MLSQVVDEDINLGGNLGRDPLDSLARSDADVAGDLTYGATPLRLVYRRFLGGAFGVGHIPRVSRSRLAL